MLGEAVLSPSKSVITNNFHRQFMQLTPELRRICHEKYRRWMQNPQSLNFEPKHGGMFAIHIDYGTHAVCVRIGDEVHWLTVLPYVGYERYLDSMR